jgi:hypothetical protein
MKPEWDIPMLNVKNYNPVTTYMHMPMHTHITMSVHWLIYWLTHMYEHILLNIQSCEYVYNSVSCWIVMDKAICHLQGICTMYTNTRAVPILTKTHHFWTLTQNQTTISLSALNMTHLCLFGLLSFHFILFILLSHHLTIHVK